MKVSEADVRGGFTANNYVLLRPAVKMDKIKHGDMELHAPISLKDGKPYDPFKSQPIVCTVESVPKKLIYGKRKVFHESVEELDVPPDVKAMMYNRRREAKFSETTLIETPVPGSMMWNTPMELKTGDIVWVSSNALMDAEQRRSIIHVDDQMMYLIKYENIYLKKSGDSVTMLNGWVLAELIEDMDKWASQAEKIGLIVPKFLRRKDYNDRYGIVRYIGSPVEYLMNDRYDDPCIQAGDIVMFKMKVNRRLEPGQRFFGKDADLIVTRRCVIAAVMQA